ncbi:arrestin domain-containing protein 3-like isoform X1 [Dermatophagoides pteronyssinus]|uniref:Arrestin domain-containing protein 3 n=2 Tax=Dermatophagoides pteronyssinus TaxID=6956 RepID=A0ABQ8JFY5_DERPT|nr:arrestin domain-containing protein 3-like isoform X1 [Dermatophagoides pteronyssinus]KAH9421536.1 Arrestin domain-containing protein 3 [Dermatophagoides pteronyssinus]
MKIILEQNDIYEPGQYIRGVIVFNAVGDIPVSECNVNLICMAEVGWTENPGIKDEGHSFHIKHKLMDISYELLALNGESYYRLGHHEIPFEFYLPENLNLPSSYQSRFGSIVYSVDVKIGEKLKRREILVEVPIRKNLWLSVGGTSEKDFGVLSFASGKITMQATLRKKGYYRGEELIVDYVIDNCSTATVKPRVTFFQTQIYMTGERHKTVESSLTEAIEGDEIGSHTMIDDGNLTVTIPVDIPLSIKSEYITLKYFLHLTLDIPLAIDIHINLPVVITTRSSLENTYDQQQQRH